MVSILPLISSHFSTLLGPFLVHHLQLVSPSCSTVLFLFFVVFFILAIFMYLFIFLLSFSFIQFTCRVPVKACLSSAAAACRAINTDHPDPLPPPCSIVHRFRYVFKATSRIGTELLYVGSSWSFCLCSSMWKGPQEYLTYEFVTTSPAVSRMPVSSNLDTFRDGLYVALQLLVWDAAFMTCSILLATFLCSCRQA